jgi:hypothetical protein
MRYTFASLAVIAVALLTTTAVGIETSPRSISYHAPTFPSSPPEAWHGHSSTAYEGALRGTAVLTRAQGEKNLLDGQARIANQYARMLSYDNDVKFTQSRIQIKELKQAYRDRQRQRRLERRHQGKQLHAQRDLDLALTYRLTDDQFNWQTGVINWSASIASPRYASHRRRIATLIDQMYRYDSAGDKFSRDQLVRACDALRKEIREEATATKQLRTDEYRECQRFLLGLKYLPHLITPPAAELVAMIGS